jgi:hypothetical protein
MDNPLLLKLMIACDASCNTLGGRIEGPALKL